MNDMEKLPLRLNKTQISQYLDHTEIVNQTVAQIIKDFQVVDITIAFSGCVETAYDELHQQLVMHIDRLIKQHYQTLISILYRIDLSEEDLKKGMLQLPDYNFTQGMAHMIIERELKKVLSRKLYS